MSLLGPLEAFGIRFHGRMWLKFSDFAFLGAEARGWRQFTWTADPAKAEKWGFEASARDFAERRLRGPFEVVKIGPNSRAVDRPA